MKCLVIGGMGFIGSHVVASLLRNNYDVAILDVIPNQSFGISDRVKYYQGDYRDERLLAFVLPKYEIVLHLAWDGIIESSEKEPVKDVELNIIPSIRLALACVRYGVRKIIFASSGGTVYGEPQELPIPEMHPTNPVNSHGVAKLTVEKYLEAICRGNDIQYLCIRASNPYGEGQRLTARQGIVGVSLGKILRNENLEIWGDGSIERDYVYVGDLAHAYVKAVEYNGDHHIFNIGSGRGVSLNDLLDLIMNVTSRKLAIEFVSKRFYDVHTNILDIENAKQELNWSPEVNLHDGLERTWKWIKSQGK